MFTVYTEKNLFEDIILFRDATPNWHSIFYNHSDIYLNMTDEELLAELVEGTPIFEFIKANGGRDPHAAKPFFDSLYGNLSSITQRPRAVFFLNLTEQDAIDTQARFGVMVQTQDTIDDVILRGTYFKICLAGDIYQDAGNSGWKVLLPNNLPPANSLVITDSHLFDNERGAIGVSNVLALADAVLPQQLDTHFCILIIAPEPQGRGLLWCNQKVLSIKTGLANLGRPYDIKFEMVFSNTEHERIAILNYCTIILDKGFCLFKTNDVKTIMSKNKLTLDRIFQRLERHEGDTVFSNAESVLKSIRTECISVKDFIFNQPDFTNKRILGDCNPDHSLINRLINDV